MKRGPWIVFGVFSILLLFVPRFLPDKPWMGDVLVVAVAAVVLGLVIWERRLIAKERKRN